MLLKLLVYFFRGSSCLYLHTSTLLLIHFLLLSLIFFIIIFKFIVLAIVHDRRVLRLLRARIARCRVYLLAHSILQSVRLPMMILSAVISTRNIRYLTLRTPHHFHLNLQLHLLSQKLPVLLQQLHLPLQVLFLQLNFLYVLPASFLGLLAMREAAGLDHGGHFVGLLRLLICSLWWFGPVFIFRRCLHK